MEYRPQYKAARAVRNLTQVDAAAKLGIAPSTLSKWESGETEPTASQLFTMSTVYGIETDKLIGRKEFV